MKQAALKLGNLKNQNRGEIKREMVNRMTDVVKEIRIDCT